MDVNGIMIMEKDLSTGKVIKATKKGSYIFQKPGDHSRSVESDIADSRTSQEKIGTRLTREGSDIYIQNGVRISQEMRMRNESASAGIKFPNSYPILTVEELLSMPLDI